MNEKSLGTLVLVVVVGLIIGSVLGQVVGNLLPDSTPRTFLLGSYSPSFGFDNDTFLIDLYVIKIKMGLKFTFNIMGLIGLAISVYLFRWYK
ncbi:MAG: hypothetical protein A2487_06540 [Candidatus Raymondbacteria bacterium RifOxyC12_full_50_8]|uniref:DUF4321 domain-containing protein n=1 Tax=Candidatus Raymondbacteria bacterium RIFOXYD12_FULL_49_13 TaxID=1817890 RepID=A0A1F7FIM6_UNCRA|nr:MAG: hypothetical protein A2248_21255 [Candidatus Raymondbacteria bacterium RIFOXYA2_FULL_49_16]OGJ95679.1 MAG: hypothetical protein A2350_12115 [Candidatus Raymondbacteria bacterium RifOxyB12_full_50_8]OGK05958.1 MAG: hypothetical protein A2487_06540 [Candidatus Raymondbacteria bacterium RifOxyC12_full_50_8]OGK06316.1 MAG: hypothetical protein A2519_08570 [Candidatus Raymondbacteria bacterium RIFOXYD12_FULL_49_13]OGP40649.1 MAG: hypothetical protein A2324_03325 [Candidatus Raymondbacteria b